MLCLRGEACLRLFGTHFFGGPFPAVPSPFQICAGFHGRLLPFSFLFSSVMLEMLLLLVLLVMVLMSLGILVLLFFWVLVLILILVSFQMVELALFVLERVRWCLFPSVSGTPPLSVHLGPALLVVCFGLELTRALHLHLLADAGGCCCVCYCCRCCGCCLFTVFGFLGAKPGDMADFFTPPAPWASSLHHHHHLPVPAY